MYDGEGDILDDEYYATFQADDSDRAKSEKHAELCCVSDPTQIPDDFIDDIRDLRSLCYLFRQKALPPISSFFRGQRKYEFHYEDNNSLDDFCKIQLREVRIPKPDGPEDEKRLQTAIVIKFPKPIYVENSNFSIDLSAIEAKNNKPILVSPLTSIVSLYLFNENLQPTKVNFVKLQNLNPSVYMALEGATNMLTKKMTKVNPVDFLNAEQLEAYNSVIEFFDKPAPKYRYSELPHLLRDRYIQKQNAERFANNYARKGDVLHDRETEQEEKTKKEIIAKQCAFTNDVALTTLFNDEDDKELANIPIMKNWQMPCKDEPQTPPNSLLCFETMPTEEQLLNAPVKRKRSSSSSSISAKKSRRRLSFTQTEDDEIEETFLSEYEDDSLMYDDDLDIHDFRHGLIPNIVKNDPDDIPKNPIYKSIVDVHLVKGAAGTGKTYLMDALNYSINVVYSTIKGSLVQDVRSNFDANGYTFCKLFCMIFKIHFYDYMLLSNTVEKLPIDIVHNFVQKFNFKNYPVNINMLPKNLCLFLDEYSMIPCPLFEFFYCFLKRYYTECTTNRKLLILLAGDCNQIQPIKSVYEDNCGKIEESCSKIFQLIQSKRMENPVFVNLLQEIFTTQNTRELLYNYFPDICNNSEIVKYDFPCDKFADYPNEVLVIPFSNLPSEQKSMYFENCVVNKANAKKDKKSEFNFTAPCSDPIASDNVLADIKPQLACNALDLDESDVRKIIDVEIKNEENLCEKDDFYSERNAQVSDGTIRKLNLNTGAIQSEGDEKNTKVLLIEHIIPQECRDANMPSSTKSLEYSRTSMLDDVIYGLDKLVAWWLKNKQYFNQTVILSKTNAVVHKANIQIFLKCRNDLTNYIETCGTKKINRSKLVRFSRIYHKVEKWTFQKPSSKFSQVLSMYILPLVVGMQYILLTTVGNFRAGDIVYLLGFTNESDQCGLIMANERDMIFILYPTYYKMRLFKAERLFGFPLCMGAAINIFNSQGKTLLQDLYLDLQNCNKNEVFVALSRARRLDQIKCIFY